MKIIFLAQGSPGRLRTPEIELAEELARRNNTVHLGVLNPGTLGMEPCPDMMTRTGFFIDDGPKYTKKAFEQITKEGADVVYAATEDMLERAFKLGKMLDIPVIGHIEYYPPWRIWQDEGSKWGNIAHFSELDYYYREYGKTGQLLTQCDHVTIGAATLKWNVWEGNEFLKVEPNLFPLEVMHLGINNRDAEDIVPADEEAHAIVTIGRLVHTKKLHKLIMAVAQIDEKKRPEVWIIGDGPDRPTLELTAKGNKVEAKFLGEFSGPKKWQIIANAKLAFQAWGSIPPGEALWMEKPCICFESAYMAEMYGSYVEYVPWDATIALSYMIEMLLDDDSYRLRRGIEGQRAVHTGLTHIWTLKNAARHFEKMMRRLIDE